MSRYPAALQHHRCHEAPRTRRAGSSKELTPMYERILANQDLERRDFLERVLEGWRYRLQSAGDSPNFVKGEERAVRKFVGFLSGRGLWEATTNDADRYGASLARRYSPTTVRMAQGSMRRLYDYLCDRNYDWSRECYQRFGIEPRQIFLPENTFKHTLGYEANPQRRALSPSEVDRLFQALHAEVTRKSQGARKGYFTAGRDYAIIALSLAFGLRANESAHLELCDFGESVDPEVKATYGGFGVLTVRYGKAVRRGRKRRRDILLVPLFAQCIAVLTWYLEEIRPNLHPHGEAQSSLWVSERGNRLNASGISLAFRRARVLAGLPKALTHHCLRHTYVTQLETNGYDQAFVSRQVGHEDLTTTGHYT